MKALVLWKGSASCGAEHYNLLGFEIRDFVCFNGFNTDRAFTDQRDNFDCVLVSQGEQHADLRYGCGHTGRGAVQNMLRRNTDLAALTVTANAWTCLGIGWINESAMVGQDSWLSYTQPRLNPPRVTESAVLNNECGFGQYTRPDTAQQHASKRSQTPNEVYVSRICARLYDGSVFNGRTGDVRALLARFSHFSGSYVFNALLFGKHHYQNMLLDFVGSERPSATAVAYLQVYRNASRVFCGSAHAVNSPTVTTLRNVQLNQHVKSVIPLLSMLYHGGGDSDIFSHTGHTGRVAGQAMKHGVFSLSEFFSNSTPMTRENRYNKGSQSENLGRSISRVTCGPFRPSDFGTLIENFRHIVDAQQGLAPYLTMAAFNRRGGTAWLQEVTQKVAAINRAGTPETLVTNMGVHLAAAFDFRAPPPPVAPTAPAIDSAAVAGAAAGFRQWVNSNNGVFGNTVVRQQTDADRARANAAGVPV